MEFPATPFNFPSHYVNSSDFNSSPLNALSPDIFIHIFSLLAAQNAGTKNKELINLSETCKKFQVIAQRFNPNFEQLRQQLSNDPTKLARVVDQIYHSYLPAKEKFQAMDHLLNLPEVSVFKRDVVNQLAKKKNLSLVNHFIRSQKSHLDDSSQYKVLQEACAQGSLDLVIYLLEKEN